MNKHPWGRDLVTALLGLWITAGEYLDGWSHIHGFTDDSFFTPWHAMLYAGLLLTGVWLAVIILPVAYRVWKSGQSLLKVPGALPTGYQGAFYGYAIFVVGAPLDFIWHAVFGLERSVEALLSPPHLLILVAWLVLVGTAWRSQRRLSATVTVPEMISLASMVALAGFYLAYKSPYRRATLHNVYDSTGDDMAANWVSALVITTTVMLVPLLWQLRDGRYRVGQLTLTATLVGLGGSLAISENWSLAILLTGVAFSVLGAFIAELMLVRLRPLWSRWRYGLPIMMAETAFLVWGGLYLGYALHRPILWPITVWVGALLFATGAGAALGAIVWRPTPLKHENVAGEAVTPEPEAANHRGDHVPVRLGT